MILSIRSECAAIYKRDGSTIEARGKLFGCVTKHIFSISHTYECPRNLASDLADSLSTELKKHDS